MNETLEKELIKTTKIIFVSKSSILVFLYKNFLYQFRGVLKRKCNNKRESYILRDDRENWVIFRKYLEYVKMCAGYVTT